MRPSDWSLIREIKVKGNDSSASPRGLQLCFLTPSSLLSRRECANPKILCSHWSAVLAAPTPTLSRAGQLQDSQSVRGGGGGCKGLHAVLGDPCTLQEWPSGPVILKTMYIQLSFRSAGSELRRSPRKPARKCFMVAMP